APTDEVDVGDRRLPPADLQPSDHAFTAPGDRRPVETIAKKPPPGAASSAGRRAPVRCAVAGGRPGRSLAARGEEHLALGEGVRDLHRLDQRVVDVPAELEAGELDDLRELTVGRR